jgi:hypothetical protein
LEAAAGFAGFAGGAVLNNGDGSLGGCPTS